MKGSIFSAAAAVMLTACTSLAPQYDRTAAPISTTWPAGGAYSASSAEGVAAEIAWRDFFTDPGLRELIALALANNRDLRVAALNIERARALYQIQRAELFPTVDAAGSVLAQRTPGTVTPDGRARTSRKYEVGVGFSAFELDFFGRVRSLNDQALQLFFATEEARRSAHLSLIAEVANAYLTLAADRERLQLAQQTMQAQQASLTLTQQRFTLGAASQLAVRQAQTTVEAARAEVARFTTRVAQDENALALLVGTPISTELLPDGPLIEVSSMAELPTGMPSEVLQQRPDIRSAEHQLQAANANIGAARATFFPRVTLTGAGGLASSALSALFTGGATAWTFLPQIAVPIFDGGRNRAGLGAARVERDITVALYEKAMQSAFREVADALAQRGTLGEELAAQQALTSATADTLRLSQARFEQGLDSYLSVLDSQRALYAAQQDLITVRLSRYANQVTLYKVLGGGWHA